MATERTRTCPRCSGTGTVHNGWCFLCWGSGTHTFTVYTAAEKADIKAAGRRRIAALETVKAAAARLDEHLGLRSCDARYADWSFWGFDRLESQEPERFAAMLDALDAGRTYDVVRGLADYSKRHASEAS